MDEKTEEPEIELTDSALLEMLQSGEPSAAEEIYTRYANRLLRLTHQKSGDQLAACLDPQDIVQSVFRTFFRRASEGHYHLPDGDELWKLFLVISLNKIRKKGEHHRAAKRDVGRTQSIGDMQLESNDTPSMILKMTIDELISKLPVEHQEVVRDRIHGFEITEIAQRNQLSCRTTERVLQLFRSRLQRELENKE